MSWSISIVGKTLGKSEAEQVQHEHDVLDHTNAFIKDLVDNGVEVIEAHVVGMHVHHRTHLPEQAPAVQDEVNFLHDVEREVES